MVLRMIVSIERFLTVDHHECFVFECVWGYHLLPYRIVDSILDSSGNSPLKYVNVGVLTHPLWSDCKERVGYGGKKFTYVSGDGVIRNMNAIFGHGASSCLWLLALLLVSCSLHDILHITCAFIYGNVFQ